MRRFINIVESVTKLRPSKDDIAEIANMVHQIRKGDCGGGQCHNVSSWIQHRFGWPKTGGTYLSVDGEVIVSGHLWNVLPDGAILDATADQIGEGHDIRIVNIDDPDYSRYDMEWYQDYHPKSDNYKHGINKRDPSLFTGELDSEAQNRIRSERGNYWWLSNKDHIDAYNEKQKQYIEESFQLGDLIRWVDYRAARVYIRSNKIVGRTKHWLPKEVSHMDKIYLKRGISFGFKNQSMNWNAHADQGIGFVIREDVIQNQVVYINGHAIYLFGQAYDARHTDQNTDNLRAYRDNAIADSVNDPDEAFVIGDIHNLGDVLSEIIIREGVDQRTIDLLNDFSKAYSVRIIRQ